MLFLMKKHFYFSIFKNKKIKRREQSIYINTVTLYIYIYIYSYIFRQEVSEILPSSFTKIWSILNFRPLKPRYIIQSGLEHRYRLHHGIRGVHQSQRC